VTSEEIRRLDGSTKRRVQSAGEELLRAGFTGEYDGRHKALFQNLASRPYARHVCLYFRGQLYNMQIVNGDQYLKQSERRITRSYTVPASRGRFLTGTPADGCQPLKLYAYAGSSLMKKGGINEVIGRLISACERKGQAYADTLPITAKPPYAMIADPTSQQASRYERYLKQKELSGKSPEEVMAYLYGLYQIDPNRTRSRHGRSRGSAMSLSFGNCFTTFRPIPLPRTWVWISSRWSVSRIFRA
jgi:hypothetical protein